jgi:hypothetical protein
MIIEFDLGVVSVRVIDTKERVFEKSSLRGGEATDGVERITMLGSE